MVKINKIQCETIDVIVILDMCSNVHAKFLKYFFNTKLKCGSILVYNNGLCQDIVVIFYFCALVVLAFITAAEVAG